MPVRVEDIYKKAPLEVIPWNIEEPPEALVKLVESGEVKPCKAVDLGCGAGNYAIYLATRGFDMTGIDISPAAIEIARENARKKGVSCTFIVADLVGELNVKDAFDFAYDWEVLHHIYPEDRIKYVENVRRLLNPGGKYLSVCFNENDPCFGGVGKYRKTRLGTVLYFSSLEEIRSLFEPCFEIEELKVITIKGKEVEHIANYALMAAKAKRCYR